MRRITRHMTLLQLRPLAWTCAAVCLALGPALPALALDDGGGRSVFAYGSGERALAMGAAFAGIADDASAPIWNPGGLGVVERREVQASHTNLFGLGFNEQYASLVLPSWRLGVASLTFRRFAVDGIEQRDDRNRLLDSNLKDAETEMALGYGRRLGDAWSLGGTVKVLHQNLAGYSGTGIGVDLGVRVQPLLAAGVASQAAESLHLGLAVRNLVEPAIRLAEDSVPDPTAVRLGLAWDQPLGSMNLLLAGDVEKTRDMSTRLHVGAELRVVKELALRVGSNNGMLAAGLGASWKDVGINYTFEDNVLGSVNRIGIQLEFGLSVQESRQLALQSEEDALQQRMNAAFERDRLQRIENFVHQVEQDLADGRWDDALDVIGMLKVLEPYDERFVALEDAAWRGRGLTREQAGDLPEATLSYSRALAVAPDDSVSAQALTRVRAESQRRAQRSHEIRELFDAGMDAFVANDLVTARTRFQHLLDLAPGDEDAQSMLGRTRDLIAQQAREEQQAAQARTASSDQARRQAETEASRARQNVPAPVATVTPPANPNPRPLTDAQRRQMAELYRSGIRAAENGKADDAVRYWELVWSSDPGYELVAEYLKREYLARGMESFAAGRLDDAVRDWEKALRVDPDDERAKGYLERARQQQNRIREISTN